MIIGSKSDRLLVDVKTRDLVEEFVPRGNALGAMADFFSALADRTRIKIVSALSISPMCVNDLSALLRLNQTTVSHQLKNLKNVRVVTCRRQGKIAFYSLCGGAILDIMLAAVNYI
jgi:ArsR family transcriptional regulator